MTDIRVSLHPQQMEVFNSPARFKVVAAGRRWGKSRLAGWLMLINALQSDSKEVYYVAPTFQQAKDTMWDMLKDIGRDVIAQAHENTAVLTLINGRKIFLKGSDRPETLRGVGLCFVVLDEYASMKPNVWEQILMPTLTDVQGKAMFIGTPEGKNHFYDLYLEGMGQPDEWECWTFNSIDNPFLPKGEVEKARGRMGEQSFRQEYEASFESFSGGIFKEEWLTYCDPSDPMPDGVHYIAVDLAGFGDLANTDASKLKRLDQTAIAVVHVSQSEWRVREIFYGRWNVRETALRILRASQQYHAVAVGIEQGSLKNAVMPYLEDTMRRLNCYPRIETLRHGGQKKTERIAWALQGRFQHGRVVLEKSGEWLRVFKNQYMDFPNPMSHDDLLDSLAYIDQIAISDWGQSIQTEEWSPLDLTAGY
jgi:Terminase-like family.